MTPIRPQFPPATPPSSPARPASDARAAFFNAVKTTQPEAAPTPVAARPQLPVPAVTRVQTQPDQPAPSRMLRPGSLLDIKV